jgi:hypothetical protein
MSESSPQEINWYEKALSYVENIDETIDRDLKASGPQDNWLAQFNNKVGAARLQLGMATERGQNKDPESVNRIEELSKEARAAYERGEHNPTDEKKSEWVSKLVQAVKGPQE